MKFAGVVLCGGRSRRMGQDKALLVIAGETLLERTVRVLSAVVDPIVVAAGVDQPLPALADSVRIVRDREAFAGPLSALSNAFEILPTECAGVFVVACDVPLLTPAVVRYVCNRLGSADAAVPILGGREQPLASAYRRELAPTIARMCANDKTRMYDLLAECRVERIAESEWSTVDPSGRALSNVNAPEDWRSVIESHREGGR